MRLDNILIAFDLDDTLYKELDYVDAVFRSVADGDERLYNMLRSASSPHSAFELLPPGKQDIAVKTYRDGSTRFDDTEGASNLLETFKEAGATLAIVTDGFSQRQRGKIDTLALTPLLDHIIISEEFGESKSTGNAFLFLQNKTPDCRLRIYVGDNPAKDFYFPNKLGWTTVMIADDGRNVKRDTPAGLPPEAQAKITISRLNELADVLTCKMI